MYTKGQSGNPGGRPKQSAELRATCRGMTSRVIQRLMEIVEQSDNEPSVVAAGKIILAYGHGAPQAVGDDDAAQPSTKKPLTHEELREIARIGAQQRLAAQQRADDDDDKPTGAPH